jgi:hypothetical protein
MPPKKGAILPGYQCGGPINSSRPDPTWLKITEFRLAHHADLLPLGSQ